MKATQTTAQFAKEITANVARDGDLGSDKEIRMLQDLELVLVGGGTDSMPDWG